MAPATLRISRAAARKSARFFICAKMGAPKVENSGREFFAAMGPAASQHLAATGRSHAGAKAMAALAHEFARLDRCASWGQGSEKRAVSRRGAKACQRRKMLQSNNISMGPNPPTNPQCDAVAAGIGGADIAALYPHDAVQAAAFLVGHPHGDGPSRSGRPPACPPPGRSPAGCRRSCSISRGMIDGVFQAEFAVQNAPTGSGRHNQ